MRDMLERSIGQMLADSLRGSSSELDDANPEAEELRSRTSWSTIKMSSTLYEYESSYSRKSNRKEFINLS